MTPGLHAQGKGQMQSNLTDTQWAAQFWAPCSVPQPKPRHLGEKWEERRKWVTLPRKVRSLTKARVWPLQRNPIRIQLRHKWGRWQEQV